MGVCFGWVLPAAGAGVGVGFTVTCAGEALLVVAVRDGDGVVRRGMTRWCVWVIFGA